MRVFTAVLLNNLRRLSEHKTRIIMFFVLTVGAVAAAVFFNTQSDIAGHIAVVSESNMVIPHTQYLNMTALEKEPPMSELAAGKYDAVIIFDGQGGYEIQTIKNDDFKNMLYALVRDPASFQAGEIGSREKGTNIFGFLMMFVLMQGISMTFVFAEDKDKKQIRRVAASPVSFSWYLCAHSLFAYLFLLVPTMAIILVVRYVFGIDIGFSTVEFFALTAILSALGTSFALFLVSMIKTGDSANMVGSAVVVLTSVLAGSFYSFDRGNKILETVIKILPQKAFLSMAELVEQGKSTSNWYHYGLYIAILTLFFFVTAVVKVRKDYVK
ncbi:MAG: ABC transporter permease [Oscillospiraceae bacterium]|nr:ABC transporter permease [Oscillospiraceae bacterium]